MRWKNASSRSRIRWGPWFGTVQRRAEGWLESEAVRAEVARIKESASDLLEYMNSLAPSLRGSSNPAVSAADDDMLLKMRQHFASRS